MGPLGEAAGACTTGLVQPVRGSTVTIGRVGLGPVEIVIEPAKETATGAAARNAAFFVHEDAAPAPLPGMTLITTDPTCNPPPAQRFAIWGNLEIGHELRPATTADSPEPMFMLDGTIKVSAHAIYTGALYEAESIVLPAGARLRSSKPGEHEAKAIWWGIVTASPFREALEVNAATESPELFLYRPNQSDAEVVEVWGWGLIDSDPNVRLVQIIFSVFSFLIGQELLRWLLPFGKRRRAAGPQT